MMEKQSVSYKVRAKFLKYETDFNLHRGKFRYFSNQLYLQTYYKGSITGHSNLCIYCNLSLCVLLHLCSVALCRVSFCALRLWRSLAGPG
jgi:hypothetical protein